MPVGGNLGESQPLHPTLFLSFTADIYLDLRLYYFLYNHNLKKLKIVLNFMWNETSYSQHLIVLSDFYFNLK